MSSNMSRREIFNTIKHLLTIPAYVYKISIYQSIKKFRVTKFIKVIINRHEYSSCIQIYDSKQNFTVKETSQFSITQTTMVAIATVTSYSVTQIKKREKESHFITMNHLLTNHIHICIYQFIKDPIRRHT